MRVLPIAPQQNALQILPRLFVDRGNDRAHDFTGRASFAAPRCRSIYRITHHCCCSNAGYGEGVCWRRTNKLGVYPCRIRWELVGNDQHLMLTFSTSVPVRMIANPLFDDAIANTSVGEKLVLVRHQNTNGVFVVAINAADEAIGVLPPTEPRVAELLAGARYGARATKIVRGRGGQRFQEVVIELSIASGTMHVGGFGDE